MSNGKDIFPIESKEGIKTMSINYMVDNENQPVVWKGPMVGNAVEAILQRCKSGKLDSILLDWICLLELEMSALTVMQSIPISGVVMVSVPQNMILFDSCRRLLIWRKC